KLPITGKRSARPAGKPGDFLIAKESLQRSLPRHFLLSASNHTERSACVFKVCRNLTVRCLVRTKTKSWGRGPTASRWSAPWAPGKRTRREDHALLIVRDEFRTGYSLIGLLARRARLRFIGTARIKLWTAQRKRIIIERKVRLSRRLSPKGFTPLIGVYLCSSVAIASFLKLHGWLPLVQQRALSL